MFGRLRISDIYGNAPDIVKPPRIDYLAVEGGSLHVSLAYTLSRRFVEFSAKHEVYLWMRYLVKNSAGEN